MKFPINNATEALIPFREDRQGLLKLHVPLLGGAPMCEKSGSVSKEGIFFEAKKHQMRRFFRTF